MVSARRVKHYRYADDPSNPCAYCVQWEQLNPDDDPNEAAYNGTFLPMMPTYCVLVLYLGIHRECQQMMSDYIEESSKCPY